MNKRQIVLEKFKRAVRSIRLLQRMDEDRFISQFCNDQNIQTASTIKNTKSNQNLTSTVENSNKYNISNKFDSPKKSKGLNISNLIRNINQNNIKFDNNQNEKYDFLD